MQYLVWAHLAWPAKPNVYHLWIHHAAQKAKQTCSSVGNLGRNLLSARFSLPALPAGASWVFAFFHPMIMFHQSKHSQGMKSPKAY